MKRKIPFYKVYPVKFTGREVKVYFNLHKKTWSVKDKKTNLVLMHCNFIALKNCVFKVSEKGRKRVLEEKRKNVHAYVEGIIGGNFEPCEVTHNEFTYNPYKYDSFVKFVNGEIISVKKSDYVYMTVDNKRPKQRLFNEIKL